MGLTRKQAARKSYAEAIRTRQAEVQQRRADIGLSYAPQVVAPSGREVVEIKPTPKPEEKPAEVVKTKAVPVKVSASGKH